ncbi:MFS general substrate transporter [Aspergillus sclerotioniger CBS 115572]|uniref:MFS general substrate transporter n=1 Tax=Aspergillus sclerotioniger CBS 115572 TaxID=1450535 RepID=A0A317VPZ7_9EURO|nr:MFS general substrate transporter [Aspergillus sclerotioniger CBS 115572]PWY76005.1 MFS general substrate transporter [Aspergillus sclerotioniger CBS 115572]
MVQVEPHDEDLLRPLLADQPTNTTKDQNTTVYWHPTVICSLLFLVMGIGSFISAAPQLRLFESIICQQYYKDSDALPDGSGIPEHMCKAGPVQAALAQLVGWQSFFDNIPSLLLALPYGILADRYGRRLIITLSFMGQFAGFAWILIVCWFRLPIKVIWFSSAFLIVGGGSSVAASVVMMVITDSTPQIKRSQIFMWFEAAVLLAEIVSPPVGSLLMKHSIWLPILINSACCGVSILLSWYMPETRHYAVKQANAAYTETPTTAYAEDHSEPREPSRTISLVDNLKQRLRVVVSQRNIFLLILSFLVANFARDSMAFLLQYISNRYSWPIAKTSYMLSFRALAQLLQFILILPWIDRTMRKRFETRPKEKDLYLSRFSITIMTIGFAALGLAPTVGLSMLGIAIYTVGSGFSTFSRSLISSLMDPTMMGVLYSTLAIMETIGSLLAGPSMAWAFRLGMNLGGVWLGMPYLISAALCASMTAVIFMIRLERGINGVVGDV